MKSDMQEHMNEMRKKMQERFQSGTFAPAILSGRQMVFMNLCKNE